MTLCCLNRKLSYETLSEHLILFVGALAGPCGGHSGSIVTQKGSYSMWNRVSIYIVKIRQPIRIWDNIK